LGDKFFDVGEITIESIKFANASLQKSNFEDVNNDGYLDLTLHFNTQSLGLTPSDTEAVLIARLKDGTLIKGIDSIRIVNK